MLMSDRTFGLLRATAVSGLVRLMLAAVSLAADPSTLTWEKLAGQGTFRRVRLSHPHTIRSVRKS
jgi:hypothetical protein